MSEPKFDGVKTKIADREFIVPSITVKQARTLWPEILELNNQGVTMETLPKHWDQGMKIIHAAISRNYPEITEDELSNMIELADWKRLLLIVSGQSGMSPGERTPVPAAAPAVVH